MIEWELYSEMNNILELCKIFKCEWKYFVYVDMSDLSLLGEKIVMRVVKFIEQNKTAFLFLDKVDTISNKWYNWFNNR